MSDTSCTACNDLREYAPDFVVNGASETVGAHLMENEGLSGADGHTDCEDLHDTNDCLVGNMVDELDAYDVCEWKDFMGALIPNEYEVNKAMIYAICGLWDKADDLCAMITNVMNPPLTRYGVMPYRETHTDRVIGTIGKKNGNPLIIPHSRSDVSEYQLENVGVGIRFGTKQYDGCGSDTDCEVFEWITPFFHEVDISANVDNGDVLWYAKKSDVIEATGMSEYFWYVFTISSVRWTDVHMNGDHRYGWVRLTVNPGEMGDNYIGIVWNGTSYPNANASGTTAPMTQQGLTFGSAEDAKLYRHSCSWTKP